MLDLVQPMNGRGLMCFWPWSHAFLDAAQFYPLDQVQRIGHGMDCKAHVVDQVQRLFSDQVQRLFSDHVQKRRRLRPK